MFAIIRTGGKQYKVQGGDIIKVEKLELEEGKKITLECLMISDGKETKIGAPLVDGVKVEGKVVGQGKGDKIVVFKYKKRKNIHKKTGHRQAFTEIEILDFGGGTKKPAAKPVAEEKAAAKTAAAKPAAKKETATKTTAAKKETAAKPAAKTTTAKKETAAKPAAKTTAAKKETAEKPAAKKTTTKAAAEKKTTATKKTEE